MRLLLDTQMLIWMIVQTRRLPIAAAALIQNPANEKLFSAASIWEIAIKASLNRADFDVDPVRLMTFARLDLIELPITSEAASRVSTLPLHHRDPFDRLLIAQAIESDAVLLTADTVLPAYGERILLTK